jgi:hypothetical protein
MSSKQVVVPAREIEPRVILTKRNDVDPDLSEFAFALSNSDAPVIGTPDELRGALQRGLDEIDTHFVAMVREVDPATVARPSEIFHLTPSTNGVSL